MVAATVARHSYCSDLAWIRVGVGVGVRVRLRVRLRLRLRVRVRVSHCSDLAWVVCMRFSSGSTSFLASRGSCGTSCRMNLTTWQGVGTQVSSELSTWNMDMDMDMGMDLDMDMDMDMDM
jgi:hypothetical protein